MADQFPEQEKSDLTYLFDQRKDDRMIKQLLNLVFTKYHDLSVSRWSIICLRLWQMIDLLFTDKSLYFTLPRSIIIIVNYSSPVDDKINFEIAHLMKGSKIYPGDSANQSLNNWGLCSLLLIKPLLIFKHHGGETCSEVSCFRM